jgi:hypothetical protein
LGWRAAAVGGQLVKAVAGEDIGVGLTLGQVAGAVDAAVGHGDLVQAAAAQRRVRIVGDGVEEGLDQLPAGRMDRVAK